MRSVRIATCTSGEPVSPSWRECSLMSSCLRSAVIDIVILSKLEVKSAHDPDISVRNLHQRDWNAFQPCTMQSVLSGYPVQDLTLTDQPCLAGGETKSRDVVQPCLKRQDYVFKGAAFPAFPHFFQRTRLAKFASYGNNAGRDKGSP